MFGHCLVSHQLVLSCYSYRSLLRMQSCFLCDSDDEDEDDSGSERGDGWVEQPGLTLFTLVIRTGRLPLNLRPAIQPVLCRYRSDSYLFS